MIMIYLKYPNMDLKDKKVAGFDLDFTIVKPKSGRKFPKDENDWKWLYHNTKEKLLQLSEDYQVVIFSNQMGLSKGKQSKEELLTKFYSIYKDINIPLIFLISDKDDNYRKPNTGLWEVLLKEGISKEGSFYVGDAAGRLEDEKNKKDFSDSDRKFAKNVGIPFYTPESFFLKEKERPWSYKS